MKINAKRIRATLLHIALVGSIAAGFAGQMSVDAAANPVRWSCKCQVPGSKRTDKCTCSGYSYDLPRSGTKEFRGYCDGSINGTIYGETRSPRPKFVNVMRGKNVTCTINNTQYYVNYTKKQCTNWGFAKRNKVTMSIECSTPY
jgi:hypothetical protein